MILTILKINDHYNNFFVAYIDNNYNNDNYVNDNISDDNDRIIMMQLINTFNGSDDEIGDAKNNTQEGCQNTTGLMSQLITLLTTPKLRHYLNTF